MSYLDDTGLATLWAKIKQYVIDNATSSIPDLSVTTAKLANLAVTTGKIANSAVTQAKLSSELSTLVDNLKITVIGVSGNSSKVVTFPAASVHVMFCGARSEYASYSGIYIIGATSSGLAVAEGLASNFTHTESGLRMTINNGHNAWMVFYFITLNGSVPTA